ncbi:MAG: MMPL family transporter [Planctomycetales bacterium]|nr:MMPL family transporter [Planctomycetales bacterium]
MVQHPTMMYAERLMEMHPTSPKKPLLSRLLQARWTLFAVAAVVYAAASFAGRGLTLDRSIENMFAPHDPILEPYRRLQRTFGQHEIVIVAYPDPSLATPEGLDRIAKIAAELRAVPGVVSVVSLLDPPAASDFDDAGRGAAFREVFAGYTHNETLDAAGVICLIQRPGARSHYDSTAHRKTLSEVRRIASQRNGGVVVGEPVLIEEAFDLLEIDGERLNTWCTALVLLTLVATLGSVRWIFLPLAVVQLTLASTRAALALSGMQLSMVSSMLSAIVTVIGVATVVHVMVRYRDALGEGRSPLEALESTWRQLARPVAFACLTDAAGFAALMASHVGPVHDFGLMMAIGSLLTLPCAVLTVPALTGLGPAPRDIAAPGARGAIEGALGRLLAGTRNHGKTVAWGSLIALAAISTGAAYLERETDFTKNFRTDSELVQSYQFVEEQFGGAGVWDVMIPVKRRPSRKEMLETLELERTLLERANGLNKAISLADAVDAGLNGIENVQLEFAVGGALSLMRARMPQFVDAIYHADPEDGRQWMRIMLRSPERLEARAKTKLIEEVRAETQRHAPQAEATGYYVLLTQLIESVLADQWTTFGIAALAVVVMMAAAFRSAKLALAAMLPNTLPVLALFGAMGWLGVKINMGAAMIAAVSVGLSVDGSIHYLMDYQRRRKLGVAKDDALRQVQSSVGRAAVLATLALVVGFATLSASDIIPTVYFGTLVSLSMIGGLVGNLAVLPVLIRWLDKK